MYDINEHIQAGSLPQVQALDGKIVGKTWTYVEPVTDSLMIRVLPTSVSHVPAGQRDVVWANVFWNGARWITVIYGLPETRKDSLGLGKQSVHLGLKSAVRKARRAVGKYATGSDPQTYDAILNQKSLWERIPSESQMKYERQYWESIEAEEMDSMYGDADADDVYDFGPYGLFDR